MSIKSRTKKISSLIMTLVMVLSLFAFSTSFVYAAGNSVKIQTMNSSSSGNSLSPKFKITNSGSSSINLSDLKIRYYYTIDGQKDQQFFCDYASISGGSSAVTGTFGTVSPSATGADSYLEIGFSSAAGTLAAGSTVEVDARTAKSDWSNYGDQTSDYSFNSTSSFTDTTKVTVSDASGIIYGTAPGVSSTPVPTVAPTVKPTVAPTVAPTATATADPTKVLTFNIGSGSGAAGSSVVVPITLANIPSTTTPAGINNFDFSLKYDTSVLDADVVSPTTAVPNSSTNFAYSIDKTTGKINFLFIDDGQAGQQLINTTGIVAYVKFIVKSTATVGTKASVSVDSSVAPCVADYQLNLFNTQINAGTVTVTNGATSTPVPTATVKPTSTPVPTSTPTSTGLGLAVTYTTTTPGGTTAVAMGLTNVPAAGINKYSFTLKYDNNVLVPLTMAPSSVNIPSSSKFSYSVNTSTRTIVINYNGTTSSDTITKNGATCFLQFQVKSVVAVGTKALINLDSTVTPSFSDLSGKTYPVTFTPGLVTVVAGTATPTPVPTTTPAPTTTPVPTATPSGLGLAVTYTSTTPGGTTAVAMGLTNVPAAGINKYSFTLKYDNNVLVPLTMAPSSTNIPSSSKFSYTVNTANRSITINYNGTTSADTITKSGATCFLQFQIKSAVAVGTKALINLDSTVTPSFADLSGKTYPLTFTPGLVTVVAK